MNKLASFENDQFGSIRTIEENGKIYFCGRDVATALGYAIPHKAVKDHCKGVLKWNIPTSSGVQSMSFIPEGDLYRLITHSKLSTAEKFEEWIFDDVLPTIRLTGKYELARKDDSASPMTIPDTKDYLTAARLIAHCPKERLGLVLRLLDSGGFDVSYATPMSVGINTADISLRIKETMERLNVSCDRLAKTAGIRAETLRKYYKGEAFPKPDKYEQIICILNSL